MTPVDVTIVLVAVATTCAIVFIGLGFLPVPSRAASIWTMAFTVVMVSSYLLAAAEATGAAALRAGAHGPVLCAIGLVWVGFRARRGVEPILIVPTILIFSAATVVLYLTAETPWYGLTLRLGFILGALYSILAIVEIAKLPQALRGLATPLLVAAASFVVMAMTLVGDGVIRALRGAGAQTEAQLRDVHSLNVLIAAVYLVCALVSLLTLSRGGDVRVSTREVADFRLVGQDRLRRAQAAGDKWWSVVDVRLDDDVDLLEASSGRAFDRITSRFADDIAAVMPAEADIHRISPARYVVLLPRPDTVVRALLSRLLERVATVTDAQAVPVRLSASIGVASATLADYDLDRLCEAAAAASEHAQAAGGDRWERAVFAD